VTRSDPSHMTIAKWGETQMTTNQKHSNAGQRKSGNEEFNNRRIAFVERARAPELAASVFKLAHLIAFGHMNRQTQTAIVGQDTLATELNVLQTRSSGAPLRVCESCSWSMRIIQIMEAFAHYEYQPSDKEAFLFCVIRAISRKLSFPASPSAKLIEAEFFHSQSGRSPEHLSSDLRQI
jgi:hypothetical protein